MKVLVHARLSVALESSTVEEAEKFVAWRLKAALKAAPSLYALRLYGESGQLGEGSDVPEDVEFKVKYYA